MTTTFRLAMGSPVVVVLQYDGGIQITVNYLYLSAVTIVPKLPLPLINQVLDSLGKGEMFSIFYLSSGFFRNGIHPDFVPLTAFCTSSGLCERLCMPEDAASDR